MKTTLSILSCLFLVGCVTQSAAPAIEFVSKEIPMSQIKGAIIETYMEGGWRLERESDHLLIFLRENTDTTMKFFYNSRYDSRVFNRETVTITESSGSDKIILRASQEIIGNYGSPFEKSTPADGKGDIRLASVKARLTR